MGRAEALPRCIIGTQVKFEKVLESDQNSNKQKEIHSC